MRKLISAALAAIIASISMISSASADEKERRPMTPEEAYVAGKVIDAFSNIFGAAIASSNQRRYYAPPPPRYFQPRQQIIVIVPHGCFYPQPGVYYNMRQSIDSAGRVVVCR